MKTVKRISIFTGHFGSGKTEVAVNFAVQMSMSGHKTAIVDFDIVNPYFRTADVREKLEDRSILVITPVYAGTNVDVPALPPEISMLFENKDYRAVFDVGGDDIGARVLSRYRNEILQDDFEIYVVINTRRPMTDTQEKIEEMVHSIEYSSGLKATSLINNTNVLMDTTPRDIARGYEIIGCVSEKLKIPVGFTSGFFDRIRHPEGIAGSGVFCMDKMIRLPWE